VDWWITQLKRVKTAEQEREHMLERLQTLSRRLLEVQEAERRHLARELHDEVGQTLTGLRLLLKPNGDAAADAVNTRFEQARDLVDELLERVRGLSFDLRPAALDQLGLLPALLALFERYTGQTGVLVDFKHQGVEGRFAPEVETTAYRIVQEALTNAARHAGVAGVTVRVWAAADLLSVQIEDRGRGFDPDVALAAPRSGGLAGMQERVLLLDGHLTIESRPGGGTEITAELPLPGQSPRGER
jgi:signal transduction histidine kinase